MVEFLNGYSDLWIYALLFFLLFLCGIGFPMAEELVLLAGGVLVSSGVLDPLLMFLSTFLGVIVGDVLLFWLGRGIGTRLTTSAYFMRWFSPQRLAKGAAFFAKYGSTTIFLARFTPGLRAPTFLLAGTMQMGLWRFAAIDILAGLIFVPLVCYIGYLFADHIDVIAAWFRSLERIIITLIAMSGAIWLIWRAREKRQRHESSVRVESSD